MDVNIKSRPSKWAAALEDPERDRLLNAILYKIERIATAKGLPASRLRMAKIIQAHGVNVGNSYIYNQFSKFNCYPFPIEAIILICKGYSIPLSEVFSADLFSDSV